MERVELNLGTEAILRALERGDLPWTLHPACDFASDPGQWGASLINNAEVMIACLDAARASSVVEVGAYAGDLTRFLLGWAESSGARVSAVDPAPQEELRALSETRPELELIEATSHEALREMSPADAYVIDGDHNYFTVSEELRLIAERAAGDLLPLLMFHDVAWPHARRDDYFAPDQIPPEYKQPTVEGGGLFPGISEPQPGGLPYKWPAAREGGPRNGVLTAVEDFLEQRPGLRLAILPAFFGLGIVWHEDAPYAQHLQQITYTLADAPPETIGLSSVTPSDYLASAAATQKTIDQVLASPEARDKLMRFFLAWLEVKEPDQFGLAASVFPEFTPAVAAA